MTISVADVSVMVDKAALMGSTLGIMHPAAPAACTGWPSNIGCLMACQWLTQHAALELDVFGEPCIL